MTRSPRIFHVSDLHGISRLGIDGVHGVTDMVEHLHHAVLRVPGLRSVTPEARTGGIAGIVYRSIHGVTGLVGGTLDLAFSRLAPAPAQAPHPAAPGRKHFLAVLNGVLGDHLAATGNPLAIRSTFQYAGEPLDTAAGSLAAAFPTAGPRRAPLSKLLVTVHGLCMHDGHWHASADDGVTECREDLPLQIASALSYASVDFHYNTGRHISDSGREFAAMLEKLVENWPVEIDELVILGHSMGGLVARSAVHHGIEAGHAWPGCLNKLVFLGTPHHGSPVERAGHWVDRALGVSRYSAPFARLGRMRSAGITDLRHGNIIAADRLDRFAHARDTRTPAMLPAHVECFTVAATLDDKPDSARSRRIGDGLVPVPSALGQHENPALHLPIGPEHRFVATATGHVELLRDPRVGRQVFDWLG